MHGDTTLVAETPTTGSGTETPLTRLLPAARVRELSRLRPLRPVVDTVVCWSLIIGAWIAVALKPESWVVLLAIPVIGNRYYGLFIIGHDAFHRRIFPTARWNDLFADLFIQGGVGAITRINKRNHLAHHQHLATERDPDRHKHCCFNKADRLRYLGFLTGLTSLGRSLRNVFFGGGSPSKSKARDSHGPRDIAILLGWQVALVGGLTLAIGWWAYPVLWLVPVYLFTYLGDSVRSFCEHSQPYADTRADAHRLITYRPPRLEQMLFSPMYMNFHAAHHLWPSIPYYNLPVADRELRQAADARLEWRTSYLGYLVRYAVALPLEECRAGQETEGAR